MISHRRNRPRSSWKTTIRNLRNSSRQGICLLADSISAPAASREQAATALKYRGLQLVIAGSFNETYKRNALNNGFLAIEAPELVQELKIRFGNEKLTVRTTGKGRRLILSIQCLWLDSESYPISPVGAAAQELIVTGGLENWVKKKLQE